MIHYVITRANKGLSQKIIRAPNLRWVAWRGFQEPQKPPKECRIDGVEGESKNSSENGVSRGDRAGVAVAIQVNLAHGNKHLEESQGPLVEPKRRIVDRLSNLRNKAGPAESVILAEAKSNPSEPQQELSRPFTSIPLEGHEMLRVHGERTQGVVKTLMNTKSKEEHEVHLKLVLQSLRKEKLYAKRTRIFQDVEVGMDDAAESYRDADLDLTYMLRLPEELNSVHDTFYVLNLKKCLADANLHVLLDEIKVDKTLHFIEEPVEIMDREIKKLKRKKIALVKVRWNSKRGPKFTWEHKDQIRIKYPQLFVDRLVKPAS
ncbi:hypothetical protein Tco_1563434 [Tanacetum coccineum]